MPTPRPDQAAAPPAGAVLLHVERLQGQLDSVRGLADQTERLAVLGTMAASIAHEINNILTPVKAYAELALSNPGERGLVTKALERAAQGVDRATRISEMILSCARAAEPARADLAEVAPRAVASLPDDPLFPVELSISPGCLVRMDATALQQVLVNLLLNSRASMPGGGPTRVRAVMEGTRVRITVRDDGAGIPPETLHRVFEPFATFGRGEAGGHRRTGLGLPICRRLVGDAGGDIGIESQVSVGTIVTVTLPAAAAPVLRRSA